MHAGAATLHRGGQLGARLSPQVLQPLEQLHDVVVDVGIGHVKAFLGHGVALSHSHSLLNGGQLGSIKDFDLNLSIRVSTGSLHTELSSAASGPRHA